MRACKDVCAKMKRQPVKRCSQNNLSRSVSELSAGNSESCHGPRGKLHILHAAGHRVFEFTS